MSTPPDLTRENGPPGAESHALVPVWMLLAAIVFAGRTAVLANDGPEPPSTRALALLAAPYALAAAGTMSVRTKAVALGTIAGAAGVIGGIGTALAVFLAPFAYLGEAMNGGTSPSETTPGLAFVVLHGVLAIAALSVMRRTLSVAERLQAGGAGIALGIAIAVTAGLTLLSR